jgi:hypothetical protein
VMRRILRYAFVIAKSPVVRAYDENDDRKSMFEVLVFYDSGAADADLY